MTDLLASAKLALGSLLIGVDSFLLVDNDEDEEFEDVVDVLFEDEC